MEFIPNEILINIHSFISPSSWISSKLVCKKWKKIQDQNFSEDYIFLQLFPQNINHYIIFINKMKEGIVNNWEDNSFESLSKLYYSHYFFESIEQFEISMKNLDFSMYFEYCFQRFMEKKKFEFIYSKLCPFLSKDIILKSDWFQKIFQNLFTSDITWELYQNQLKYWFEFVWNYNFETYENSDQIIKLQKTFNFKKKYFFFHYSKFLHNTFYFLINNEKIQFFKIFINICFHFNIFTYIFNYDLLKIVKLIINSIIHSNIYLPHILPLYYYFLPYFTFEQKNIEEIENKNKEIKFHYYNNLIPLNTEMENKCRMNRKEYFETWLQNLIITFYFFSYSDLNIFEKIQSILDSIYENYIIFLDDDSKQNLFLELKTSTESFENFMIEDCYTHHSIENKKSISDKIFMHLIQKSF